MTAVLRYFDLVYSIKVIPLPSCSVQIYTPVILSSGSRRLLCGGLRPATGNPYPISDKNMQFFLPFFRPFIQWKVVTRVNLRFRAHNFADAVINYTKNRRLFLGA